MAIVTISRQVGSGGSEIARNLASRLGFELLDRRGLETMLPSYGLVEHELLDLGGLPEDPGQLGRLRPQSLPPGRQLLNISAIKFYVQANVNLSDSITDGLRWNLFFETYDSDLLSLDLEPGLTYRFSGTYLQGSTGLVYAYNRKIDIGMKLLGGADEEGDRFLKIAAKIDARF